MNHSVGELDDIMFVFTRWPALKHKVMGGPENAVEIGPDIGGGIYCDFIPALDGESKEQCETDGSRFPRSVLRAYKNETVTRKSPQERISVHKFGRVGCNPSVPILKPRTDYYAGCETRRCEYAGMSHSECTKGQLVQPRTRSTGATQNSLRDHIDSL